MQQHNVKYMQTYPTLLISFVGLSFIAQLRPYLKQIIKFWLEIYTYDKIILQVN